MANTRYAKGKEKMLRNTGSVIGWDSDADIRIMLVKSTYTFADSDEFVSDISAHDNGRSSTLTGLTNTNGIADADDASVVATDAEECDALVLYEYDSDDAAASLLGYIDTATGLPVVPAAGATLQIFWANSAAKIFKE